VASTIRVTREPGLRFVMLGILLAALGIAIASGSVADAAIIGTLALLSGTILGARLYARMRQ
jgi:hypothetical protein